MGIPLASLGTLCLANAFSLKDCATGDKPPVAYPTESANAPTSVSASPMSTPGSTSSSPISTPTVASTGCVVGVTLPSGVDARARGPVPADAKVPKTVH